MVDHTLPVTCPVCNNHASPTDPDFLQHFEPVYNGITGELLYYICQLCPTRPTCTTG